MRDNLRNPGDHSDHHDESDHSNVGDRDPNDASAPSVSASDALPLDNKDTFPSGLDDVPAPSQRTLDPDPSNLGEDPSDVSWEEVEAVLSESSSPSPVSELSGSSVGDPREEQAEVLPYGHPGFSSPTYSTAPPLALVETAFLSSTASLLWLISYYLSIGPWMRILFPIPIALVHLRWGNRAAWMAAIVSGLLLSVLMGPYLSILFLIPYGILGVQLGFLWQKKSGWGTSITIGTIVATISLFFRLWLLSTFLGEDLWIYLTGRITDLLEWVAGILVNWGILGVGMLGQPNLHVVQLATVGMVIFSDLIYLFTVHLAAWLLLERLGNPISTPPQWVQILLDEAQ